MNSRQNSAARESAAGLGWALGTRWHLGGDLLRAGYRCEVVTTLEGLKALEQEWLRLYAVMEHPALFQSPSWCVLMAEALMTGTGAQAALRVIAVRAGSHLVGVMPLALTARHGVSVLTNLGEPMSHYADVVVAPGHEGAVDAGVDTIAAMTDVDLVALRRLRGDTALARTLRDAGAQTVHGARAGVLAFEGATDADALGVMTSSRGLTSALAYRHDQARMHGLSARVLMGRNAREAAKAALALSSQKTSTEGRPSPLAEERWSKALAAAVTTETVDLTGLVSVVERDGEALAYDLCAISGNRLYGLHTACVSGTEEKALTALAVLESVCFGVAHGLCGYDFTPRGQPCAGEWASEVVALDDVLWPRSTVGRTIGLTLETRMKPWLNENITRLPMALRRLAARL
jgi:CelD/BcsL family acetyltransferase involved in cellulose biosynthesis